MKRTSIIFSIAVSFLGSARAWEINSVDPNWGYGGIALHGHYALVTPILYDASTDRGFRVIDVQDPTHMQIVGDYFHLPKGGRGTIVSGDVAYSVTNENSSGPEFYAIDVSHPESLSSGSILGSLELGVTPKSFVVSGSYAYVAVPTADSNVDALVIIDISNPSEPLQVSKTNISRPGIITMDKSGNYLYVGGPLQYVPDTIASFRVIDVSNLQSPQVVNTCWLGRVVSSMSVKVVGSYAFVGNYDGSDKLDLSVVDISNPLAPLLVQTLDMGSRPISLNSLGTYLIASYENYNPTEVEFIDIKTPSNSARLDGISVGVHVYDTAVYGDYLLLSTEYGSPGRFQSVLISSYTQANLIPPVVSFEPLSYSDRLSGVIRVVADASDDMRVESVQFKMDGTDIGVPVLTEGLASSYTLTLYTTNYADGPHTLGAQATDNSGLLSSVTSQAITVDNADGDQIPPTVTLTIPGDGDTISNYMLIRADASDNMAVAQVQFFVDGAPMGLPVLSSPYAVSWDTTLESNGSHQVSATVTDTSSQTAQAQISVTVSNNLKATYSAPYPTPIRTRFVAPVDQGTGDGGTIGDAMGLAKAIAAALPGDLFWLTRGTYRTADQTSFMTTVGGTAAHPIVWRAWPGAHAEMVNGIQPAAYNWIWGLDVSGHGISTSVDGIRIINNLIHDTNDGAIGGGLSQGIVYYGNIIYSGTEQLQVQRSHNVYVHNDYEKFGYQYYVNNVILDGPKQSCNAQKDSNGNVIPGTFGDCFIFHAYTETDAPLSGFYLEKNIVAQVNGGGSRFLIGGFGTPADREVLKDNFFFNVSPEFGYRRPTQAEMRGNYLGNGGITAYYWWGAGEIIYTQKAPNCLLNNKFYLNSNDRILDLRTSAYYGGTRYDGVPALQPTDVVDDNVYGASFHAGLDAAVDGTAASLASWQVLTSTNGNTFDLHSSVASLPTDVQTFVVPNDYEPGRGHLAIYNWGHASNVQVDISSVVSIGSSFAIVKVERVWDPYLVSGVYHGGTVAIPTEDQDFIPLLVVSTTSGQIPLVPDFENKNIFLDFKNVFNPTKESLPITFFVATSNQVTLTIFNRQGQKIKTLLEADKNANETVVVPWDGRNDAGSIVASGVYILVLKVGGDKQTKPIVLVK